MNKIPNKIEYHLGYKNLGLILDQERKHWLMKTDKKNIIQDVNTGDKFQGTIDNIGSDVIIESQKLLDTNDALVSLIYSDDNVNDILKAADSAFTYSNEVNGLMFARIISINYPTSNSITNITHRTYKLKLTDCEECIIPFGASVTNDAVFADRWLKTSTIPKLLVMDNNGEYTIEVSLNMNDCTNPVFYYPLNESLQTLPIHEDTGVYTTDGVVDDTLIGYPLYWFTCDETNTGPSVSISNNRSNLGRELCIKGNPGNGSKYNVELFVGVDGNNDATPDDSLTSSYSIICSPLEPNSFDGSNMDFYIPLDISSIKYVNNDTNIEYPFGISFGVGENSYITMSKNSHWTMVDDNKYSIPMNVFDVNCLNNARRALIPVFDVHLDQSIKFSSVDKSDLGYAGIRMGAANGSDVYPRYPYDLNKWDGLPEWMNNLSDGITPQHLAVYAIHNTKGYVESDPSTRQTAALLFDPGKAKTDDSSELTNDERGRVYLLSNDDTQYRNNLVEKSKEDGVPKPDRTLARICDIPTSLFQLFDVSGLEETIVVDKNYVRSTASYTDDDKNRLWNEVNWYDRWVRPSAKDVNGTPITAYEYQNGDSYIFQSESLLKLVDMYDMNDFRIIENLNPIVDANHVSVYNISEPGSGYNVNDTGTLIVGGFAFVYQVEQVDSSGAVTDVSILSDSGSINLSNFDMMHNDSGITIAYGTSPFDPSTSGTGLKIQLFIDNYADLLPKKGDFLDMIHAFVREQDGIFLYEYDQDPDSLQYSWVKKILVSPFERSSEKGRSGLSTPDAYMHSIIPSYERIQVSSMERNKALQSINAMTTTSFVNIIDKTKTPITPTQPSQSSYGIPRVDICKWICRGITYGLRADVKSFNGMFSKLKSLGVLRYDCYIMWRWDDPEDPLNKSFSYGIISRSLNNYVSTDVISKIPNNDLRYHKYVHTNISSTVVWDAPGVNGVMMWVYDPNSTRIEKYNVDANTQELYADRIDMSWDQVDIYGYSENIKILDNDGKFLWNIMTNNPANVSRPSADSNEIIYQQPEFVNVINIGDDSSEKIVPTGNWKLVFPRCESFTIRSVQDGTTFKPVKLQMIRGENITNLNDVLDENGDIVNSKMLVLEEKTDGLQLNMFNNATGQWSRI